MSESTVPPYYPLSVSSQSQAKNLQAGLDSPSQFLAAWGHSGRNVMQETTQRGEAFLSNEEMKVVNLIASATQGCHYCRSTHSADETIAGMSEAEILDLGNGHSPDAKLNALVSFTRAISETKGHVVPGTVNAFYTAGYDEGSLVDVVRLVSDKMTFDCPHCLHGHGGDFRAATG